MDDYLYNLSIAQIQFMAIDNTHQKYLKGADKKAWSGYKEAYEAQRAYEKFYQSLSVPKQLKAGEEYEIPMPSKKDKV